MPWPFHYIHLQSKMARNYKWTPPWTKSTPSPWHYCQGVSCENEEDDGTTYKKCHLWPHKMWHAHHWMAEEGTPSWPHSLLADWKDKASTNWFIISAELPNPDEDKELFDIVKTKMIHGPCGSFNPRSPCMEDGKCTKKYPRAFIQETQTGTDGYPLYKRRKPDDGGFTHTMVKNIGGRPEQYTVDNRWVVPYNPLLSKAFDAHINVEICTSIKSIKYVCKSYFF